MSAKMIVTDDALHAAREVMELAGYFSPMPETWDKAFRAMANAMPAPVSVKALEWWEPDHTNNYTHGAETIIGTYYVHIDGGRHMGCMETFVNDKIEQWEGPERGSLYQAQNDAQADYERRVLSALSPQPVEAEPVAWMHPTAGWSHTSYDEVRKHCLNNGPLPNPLYASPRKVIA